VPTTRPPDRLYLRCDDSQCSNRTRRCSVSDIVVVTLLWRFGARARVAGRGCGNNIRRDVVINCYHCFTRTFENGHFPAYRAAVKSSSATFSAHRTRYLPILYIIPICTYCTYVIIDYFVFDLRSSRWK